MGTNGKRNASDDRCGVIDERNGVIYRCSKRAGHEHEPGDWEHIADAPEYVRRPMDWQAMMREALPVLEWAAANAPSEIAERAKRIIIRVHVSATSGPPIVRAKPRE